MLAKIVSVILLGSFVYQAIMIELQESAVDISYTDCQAIPRFFGDDSEWNEWLREGCLDKRLREIEKLQFIARILPGGELISESLPLTDRAMLDALTARRESLIGERIEKLFILGEDLSYHDGVFRHRVIRNMCFDLVLESGTIASIAETSCKGG